MLIEFSVANYRSFREKVTLSMVASERDKTLPGNTFETGLTDAKGRPLSPKRLLKSAAVYGANASGKTNLLGALDFMVLRVLGHEHLGRPHAPERFRLDPACRDQPSDFEIAFIQDGQQYSYSFSLDGEKVVEEWLEAGRRLLFERASDGAIKFGDSWRGEAQRLASRVGAERLFLTVAAEFQNPTAGPAAEWFRHRIGSISNAPELGPEMQMSLEMLRDMPDGDGLVLSFLTAADLGIAGITAEEREVSAHPGWREMPAWYHNLALLMEGRGVGARGETYLVPKMLHRALDGSDEAFDLEAESAGTTRLLSLVAPFMWLLSSNALLVFDEFDAKLHPLVSRHLLHIVHKVQARPQIVFATHDTSLLDTELLRADQVWFTEKRRNGSTDLYSLAEFKKVRGLTNTRSGYMTGRYGAVPFIREWDRGATAS